MRRYLLLAILLCCVLLFVSCSGDTTPTSDGIMTAVTDDKGAVTGYERRYHNADGLLSRLDVYDADKVYLNYSLYEYDDEGRLSTETYYGADGIALSRDVYTYSEDGKLYEKAHETPSGEAKVERYDADGEVVEKLYYDSDGKLYQHDKLTDSGWVSTPSEI